MMPVLTITEAEWDRMPNGAQTTQHAPTTGAERTLRAARRKALEESFATLYRQLGGPGGDEWRRSYQFDLPNSGMEIDFAFPDLRIGVEINGGQAAARRGKKSGHSNWSGLARDARKINRCVITGWKLFVLTTAMVEPGSVQEIIDYIKGVRDGRSNR